MTSAATLTAVLIGLSLTGGKGSPPPSRPAEPAPLAGAAETRALLRGIPQAGIALGSARAPVTLVEFADLQCPYCAHWARDAFPAIVREYVSTGRVRIVFRGLAFLGPDSDTALRAALAAGRQDRLWDVVHLLYANQGVENGGWVTNDLLAQVGEAAAPLDDDRWLGDFRGQLVERQLEAAALEAETAGIRGTPSFLAGRTGSPLRPLALSSLEPSELRAHLDALLAA